MSSRRWESTSSTPDTKYAYTSQHRNIHDFGLMFYNARWYDPTIGRFVQADTVVPGGVQGYDRYAYGNNDPVLYSDPTGHNYCDHINNNNAEDCNGGESRINKSDNLQRLRKQHEHVSIKDKAIGILTGASLVSDTLSFLLSFGEAGIADFFYAGTIGLTIVQPETAPDIGGAYLIDAYLAGPANPVGALEDVLGVASFLTTAGADALSGNTSSQGIGNDTIVAGRNMLLGMIPESNVDFAVSASQLKYDVDRLNGIKTGGSIRYSDIGGLANEVIWNDSPFQDIAHILGIVP